jgi:hypothetical protein
MKAYIDKSALVAEIDKWKEDARKGLSDYAEGVYDTCEKILSFLNTLEVKEEPEFTVDDIMKLDALLIRMWQSKSPNKYEEVLKQFKAQKGE